MTAVHVAIVVQTPNGAYRKSFTDGIEACLWLAKKVGLDMALEVEEVPPAPGA